MEERGSEIAKKVLTYFMDDPLADRTKKCSMSGDLPKIQD